MKSVFQIVLAGPSHQVFFNTVHPCFWWSSSTSLLISKNSVNLLHSSATRKLTNDSQLTTTGYSRFFGTSSHGRLFCATKVKKSPKIKTAEH